MQLAMSSDSCIRWTVSIIVISFTCLSLHVLHHNDVYVYFTGNGLCWLCLWLVLSLLLGK